MHIGFGMIGMNYWFVKVLANIVVLILNYVISKIFVFRNKEVKTAEQHNE